MDKDYIGIGIALLIPILTLYHRKQKWLKPNIVWICFSILLIIGLIGLLYIKPFEKDERILYYGLCNPFAYWTLDRLFKYISIKVNKRDFILFLRNSYEINDGVFSKNPHVDYLDKTLSISLLAIICINILVGVIYL